MDNTSVFNWKPKTDYGVDITRNRNNANATVNLRFLRTNFQQSVSQPFRLENTRLFLRVILEGSLPVL